MPSLRTVSLWALVVFAISLPVIAVATSPLLAWRDPIYIAAGLAGVIGLALMLVQPLLALGVLPGLPPRRGRRVHRWIGAALVILIGLHIGGLWITSPPDVVDALLLRSPTPFSLWGVISMWAILAVACLAMLKPRLRVRIWRLGHTLLFTVIVATTILHALLIDGTMESVTKFGLSTLTAAATLWAVLALKAWKAR